jgi:chromosome segregation ATPase
MLRGKTQRIRSLEAKLHAHERALTAHKGVEAALLAQVRSLERQLHEAEEALRGLSSEEEEAGRLQRLREDLVRLGTPGSSVRQPSPRGWRRAGLRE